MKLRDLLIGLFVDRADGYCEFGGYSQVQCADDISKGIFGLI